MSEKSSNEVMSLPINSFLTTSQINYITSKIQEITC